MRLTDVNTHTQIPLASLEYAALQLQIPPDDHVSDKDLGRIQDFLDKHGSVRESELRLLGQLLGGRTPTPTPPVHQPSLTPGPDRLFPVAKMPDDLMAKFPPPVQTPIARFDPHLCNSRGQLQTDFGDCGGTAGSVFNYLRDGFGAIFRQEPTYRVYGDAGNDENRVRRARIDELHAKFHAPDSLNDIVNTLIAKVRDGFPQFTQEMNRLGTLDIAAKNSGLTEFLRNNKGKTPALKDVWDQQMQLVGPFKEALGFYVRDRRELAVAKDFETLRTDIMAFVDKPTFFKITMGDGHVFVLERTPDDKVFLSQGYKGGYKAWEWGMDSCALPAGNDRLNVLKETYGGGRDMSSHLDQLLDNLKTVLDNGPGAGRAWQNLPFRPDKNLNEESAGTHTMFIVEKLVAETSGRCVAPSLSNFVVGCAQATQVALS